ncbi:LOW QUALITY PROTEIN: probable disease resistance protein At5g63020 [Jatropha curcas]|uniref:LOW QUALITY PROTEIN: probable disease resistance protein At5g63020 n=1 Tax=Jatropha curcas TaxID=180498 RepID=UPI001892E883|nr:LOW QUALITY PROTEIN: probable disease resistance protein At5g63020 [Jatropha curcas]
MGNVFQIQCGDALAGRCWDCIAGHWQYIYKLEDNLEALETTRDQLRDLRTDVMRLIVNQERPEMAQMDRVGGWLSRVDAAIVKINQLLSKAIQERQKLSIAGCCSKNCKSSYTFGRSVAKCLKTVIALMNEGDFKEVVMAEPANQLQANLEALRTAREELYALKEDVMQSVALEEGPEKMLLPQVRLWLSMAESTITEADELIPDGPPEIQKLSHGDISNYRFVGRVAKKLDDVAVVKAKGVFKELVRRIPAEPDYISQLQVDLRALESIMKELKALKEGAMMRITSEEGPQKKRKPQVQLWLSMLEAIVTGAEEMIRNGPQEIEKLRRKDPSSYEFVRKVAKVLEEAVALRDKGEFKEVVERVLPDPVAERNDKPTFGTETMLDDIWRWLTQDEQLGTVGIYGMGGVGKTTLLNQINNRFASTINNRFASTTHNFDVVIWVVVSKDLKPDKIQEEDLKPDKIQEDIWKKVGIFDETWAKKIPSEKAEDIFYRLSRTKFVLFLDDLWQKVDLRDIGVPLQKKHGSMIVFTTRFYKICRQMEAQKIMKVEPLNPRESWTLFQEKVGDIPPNILPLAKDVVKECGGLPLALITIGHAMAGKDALQEWEHALEVLRSYASSLHGMEDEMVFQDMEVEVFAILKFSYDSLHGDKVKSCFLYCSLFPEDFEILKDDLVHYWISENFCARNEGYAIIGSLVRVCLLEENGKYVKMHDVIRDMALWIACKYEKDKEKFFVQWKFFVQVGAQLTKFPAVEEWEGSKRVSLMANSFKSIREVPRCGDLSTLFLGHNSFLKEISSDFFQYMNSLMVLDLSGTCIMILTEGISKLTSLQYLNLRSTRIRRLPVGLKFLQKLKYLNLGHNEFLKFIPRGVISCLSSSLQILIMCPTGAFMYENSVSNLLGEGNTLIEELQCLENLNELSLTIESVSMLQLFSSTQTLLNCTRSLQLSRFFSQRSLGVSSLANFRNLETLYIFFTCDLEELIVDVMVGESSTHHHTISNSMVSAPVCFNSLREVNVSGNVHLRELTWVVLIPNLEILIVKFNEHMKEIVSAEKLSELQVGSENMNLFSKLQVLELFTRTECII